MGKSTARSDTFLIMSCAFGLTLGVASKFALNLENIGKIRNYDNIFKLCLMRSIIGITNIVIGRFLSKKTIYIMVKLKYNFGPKGDRGGDCKIILESVRELQQVSAEN